MSGAFTRHSWFRFLMGIVFGFGLGFNVCYLSLVKPWQRLAASSLASAQSLSNSFDKEVEQTKKALAAANEALDAFDKQTRNLNEAYAVTRRFCLTSNGWQHLVDPNLKPLDCNFVPVEPLKRIAYK